MNILQLLNSDGYICCSKMVIKALGVFEALVIGKLCSVSQRFSYQEFYISIDKICEDVGLSEYQVRQALNSLKDCGVLSITKKGTPCRNYYTLNEGKIIELLELKNPQTSLRISQTSSEEIKELEVEKLENKHSNNCTTFKVMKKDNNKDMEKEINNIVSPSPKTESNFSVSDCVQSECLDEQKKAYQELHRRWVTNDLPMSTSSASSYFSFSCKELKSALGDWSGMAIKPSEILNAVDNYIKLADLIKSGGSWMDSVGNFGYFAKHILDFLEGNFNLDRYKKRSAVPESKPYDKEEAMRKLEEQCREWGIEV